MCRNYLWTGTSVYTKAPLVSWAKSCRTKKEGGLGIRDCTKWNQAFIGKLIWDIASKKDALWVKWISHTYLKEQGWQEYTLKGDCSWMWRKIYEVKEILKKGYSGDLWVCNIAGYTVSSGYKWLNGKQPRIEWSRWVWNPLNLPKSCFIGWIIAQNRLNTRARLFKLGVVESPLCALCGEYVETCSHLFFVCFVSRYILQELKNWLGWRCNTNKLQGIRRWVVKRKNFSKTQRLLQGAIVQSLAYAIWNIRNEAVFEGRVYCLDKMWRQVKTQVRLWLQTLCQKRKNQYIECKSWIDSKLKN